MKETGRLGFRQRKMARHVNMVDGINWVFIVRRLRNKMAAGKFSSSLFSQSRKFESYLLCVWKRHITATHSSTVWACSGAFSWMRLTNSCFSRQPRHSSPQEAKMFLSSKTLSFFSPSAAQILQLRLCAQNTGYTRIHYITIQVQDPLIILWEYKDTFCKTRC